jgi:hypothetical protein
VFDLVSAAADAFLGFKIIYNCPAVGWIEGEVVKRKVNRRMKIGSDIVYFFVFFSTPPSAQSDQLQQRWISRGS